MDTAAGHEDSTQRLDQPDGCMARVRALLVDYVACGRRLRALHEQYLALPHGGGQGNEQRHEAYSRILDAELDVLAEAQSIHQALHALLDEHRSHLRSGDEPSH